MSERSHAAPFPLLHEFLVRIPRFLALIGFVLVATGTSEFLFFLDGERVAKAHEQREALTAATARLRLAMLQMVDALRGQLMEQAGAGDAERRRKTEADADFVQAVATARQLMAGHPEVVRALDALAEFDDKRLNEIENRIGQQIGTDRAAATVAYTQAYLPLRREQDALLEKFETLARNEMNAVVEGLDRARQWKLLALGLVFIAVVAFAVAIARSISRPIEALTRAVARLAEGDLAVELPERKHDDEIGQLTRSFGRFVASLREFSAAASRVAKGDLTVEFKPQSERDVMGNALAQMGRNLAALVGQVQKRASR